MDSELLEIGYDIVVAVGLLAFAVSGALLAVAKRMDFVGIAFLAVITTIGGGIARDVLIGAVPPLALTDPTPIAVAIAGAIVVFVLSKYTRHFTRFVLVFDAIGLGIFVVQGTLKGIDYGLHPWAAAIVGMLTGIGGGLLRDVLANDIPAVFRKDSRLYLVPALLGASAAAMLVSNGVDHPAVLVVVAVATATVRVLSEVLDWRVPSLATTTIDVQQSREQE